MASDTSKINRASAVYPPKSNLTRRSTIIESERNLIELPSSIEQIYRSQRMSYSPPRTRENRVYQTRMGEIERRLHELRQMFDRPSIDLLLELDWGA